MTTPRKPRPHEAETDRRRTEKENLTVTVELSKQTGVRHFLGFLNIAQIYTYAFKHYNTL